MYISWFLAKKFLLGASKESNIKSILLVSFLSITIGTFSLALVAAIMNGFEKETHKKLQGINSDIVIRSKENLNFEKISKVLSLEFKNKIESFTPSKFSQLIIKNNYTNKTILVAVKAIDPETIANSTTILESVSKNPQELKHILEKNSILIGTGLADQLDVLIDEEISLLFSQEENISRNKITLDSKKSIISGIFKTGIDEIDNNLIIMSLDSFKDIFPDLGVTTIEIKATKNINLDNLKEELQNRLDLNIYTWKDLYPTLVSALVLEKTAMIFILALITLVACMNLVSLLYMYIAQKRVNIAILRSLGMNQFSISAIFIFIGMLLSLLATTLGLILCYIAVYILNKYPFIKLPDVYYVSHLPAELDLQIYLIVISIVTILSFLASWIPSKATKQINIATILKFESQ